MKIKGFQGTSLLDFPGRIAALVFTGGCNLTCSFCHNPTLVLEPGQYPDYPVDHLLVQLEKRRTFIDGVVVSGGEPTLDPGLLPFLRSVKGMGLQVKLDTNALLPKPLEKALAENLVDYLAVDLKTAPARYGELHPGPVDLTALAEGLRLTLQAPCDYELRTTCVPGLVEEADIRAMGEAVRGAKRWMFQQFAPGHALDPNLHEVEPHAQGRLEEFAEMARGYAEEVGIRGI